MPAVSFYLPDDVLAHLKAESKARNKAVSSMVREAVQRYLEADEKREAKAQFIRLLDRIDLETWEDVHGQRQESEISRS
jgi:predicted DNA-binding protein